MTCVYLKETTLYISAYDNCQICEMRTYSLPQHVNGNQFTVYTNYKIRIFIFVKFVLKVHFVFNFLEREFQNIPISDNYLHI